MKKLLILLLSLSLLTSCKDKKTTNRDDRNTSTRDKDDYRDGDDGNKDDKTSSSNDDKTTDDRKIDRNSGNYDDVVDDDEEGNHIPDSKNWTSSEVRQFVTPCVDKAVENGVSRSKAEIYCNCMQQRMERKFPDASDVSNFDKNSSETKGWIQDCQERSGITGTSSTSSSSAGWSRKDELEFVNNCVGAAEKGGMEYLDAQSYCDCMQYKLEKLYPDVRDASRLTDADFATPSMKKMIKSCLPGN